MTSFEIHPLSRFESGSTAIRRPKHFLQFSFDEQHAIQFSDQSLRYYYPPFITAPGASTPSIDLSNGFKDWIKQDESIDSHLDGLLDTIQRHEEALLKDGASPQDARTQADIITWRGMMTKIMAASFDMFSDFEMNATYYQVCMSSSYVEENYSYGLAREQEQHSRKPSNRQQPPQELMQYWGYKFESLSTLPKPWAECNREQINTRDAEPVNTNIQYCSIVRTRIGNTSLVIGGEVDCIMGEKPDNPDAPISWVELKTTAEPPSTHHRETIKFERKLCRFWAQSFLLGVPKIIIGYRSQDGFLTRIQELETQKLPGLVSRSTGCLEWQCVH
ncbi:decapping endonuclease targeting mRNA [Vermiconidia calcicola]|uniref:Decapping endonuclease targeting mRNA n=1 Tax=Vermiconidia calcicola TaxID=1690605 RepID=A0ACC3NII2_9PEZI|nr:decapping endonuclease targeting mRNA [Vermiconidia calcicola]